MEQILMKSCSSVYVFDIKTLQSRVAWLRSLLPEDVSLCFAVKANPFLTKEASFLVERLELCSPGEADIFRHLALPSEKSVISGVYKTPDDIRALVREPSFRGIITIESIRQYQILTRQLETEKKITPVLLRLTNGSQFGLDETHIDEIIRHRSLHPYLQIRGIQFFSGTQKTSLKKYTREIAYLDRFLTHLKEDLRFEAKELEYGPGFPVSYFEEEPSQEELLLQHVSELLNGMKNKSRLVLELGRSIAASCGRYYTHIVDLKRNNGQNYALVDGGMHQMVYFGQSMAMKRPRFSVFGKEGASVDQLWTVCGSLCSMNDVLLKQTPMPKLEIGDILCFENTGAYCMTEGISLFLSRDLPFVYLKREDESLQCIRPSIETQLFNYPH
ncbi:MAG: alanine racemase [Clostridia bacterium]|nr:alanine racemase [Clostridia bacterium]